MLCVEKVFQDLHKLNPGNGSREPAKDSIKILEDHLGKTRDRIEDDFMVWFTKIQG